MNTGKRNLKLLGGILCGVAVVAVMILAFAAVEHILNTGEKEPNNDDAYSYSSYDGEQVNYQGAYYTPNPAVDAYLLLGIDSDASRPDATQSDFLALLVLNRETETYEVLHLNRDTMVDIAMINHYGETYGTVHAQLALAHNYGADDKARCRNTVRSVEKLLYGIQIDHFVSVTMEAVPILNDAAGGVTVTLSEDFTFLDPTFTEGATVTLAGDQALSYVRARGGLEDSTNLARMERQKEYIGALAEALDGDRELSDVILQINDHMATNCTVDQLERLAERLQTYTYVGLTALPGEAVVNEYVEYYPDEEVTKATVIRMFYKPVPTSDGEN